MYSEFIISRKFSSNLAVYNYPHFIGTELTSAAKDEIEAICYPSEATLLQAQFIIRDNGDLVYLFRISSTGNLRAYYEIRLHLFQTE